MAISNLQETLLMYTKQKAMLNDRLTSVMFNITEAARKTAEEQQRYNEKEKEYYNYYADNDDLHDEYQEVMEQLLKEHEFDIANLESWEAELEVSKDNYETRLNTISQYEASFQKLLSANIKRDFSYGGMQQGG